ncbi:hypothetical protein HYU12_05530, partial [Candidatus Woesearchaeota archaeon]|nr:hypothetical protein [Candidatus Woesearchaeota archaeon]
MPKKALAQMKKPEKATTTPNNSKLKLLTILAAMLVLLWGIDQLGTNQNTPTGYQTSETADLQIRGTPTYDKETGKLTIEVKNAGENLVDKFYVTVDVLEENTDKQVIGTIGIVITWSDRENAIESGETRVIEYLLDSQTPSIKENSKSRNLVLRVGVASIIQDGVEKGGEVVIITIKSDTTPTTQTAATSTPTTIKTGQSANALIPAYNLKGGIEKEVILIKESSPALDVDFIMAHKNNCKIKDEGYYYYNVINAPRERIYIIKPEEDCQFHPEARIEDLPKADLTAKNLKKGDIYFFAVLPETTGKSVKEWMPECKIKDSSAANKLQTSDIGTAFTFSVEEDCTTELKGETKTTTQTAITSTPATTKAGTTTTNIPGFNLKEGQHLVAVTPNMIGATKKDLLKGGRLAGNCIIQKVGGL